MDLGTFLNRVGLQHHLTSMNRSLLSIFQMRRIVVQDAVGSKIHLANFSCVTASYLSKRQLDLMCIFLA